MSATLTQLSPQPSKPDITEEMIEAGARAAYDAIIDGRTSGALRFDQLPTTGKRRVILRFGIGLRAAIYGEEPPKRRHGLTPAQRKLLDVIANYIDEHNHSPSYSEMCRGLGYAQNSKGHVHSMLNQLEERGYITRIAHRSRSIEIVRREETV